MVYFQRLDSPKFKEKFHITLFHEDGSREIFRSFDLFQDSILMRDDIYSVIDLEVIHGESILWSSQDSEEFDNLLNFFDGNLYSPTLLRSLFHSWIWEASQREKQLCFPFEKTQEDKVKEFFSLFSL